MNSRQSCKSLVRLSLFRSWLYRLSLIALWCGFSTSAVASIELVSRMEGVPPIVSGANRASGESSISEDGRYVAFASSASNLASDDTNGSTRDIFVFDRETNVTQLLTPGANGSSYVPSISANGRVVAFSSEASNLAAGDTNGSVADVFAYDLDTGVTTLISAGGNNSSTAPSISADGQIVAFQSRAGNLVAGDNNQRTDVFIHDRSSNTSQLLTVGGNDSSLAPSISGDGRFVALYSAANNLVAGDLNGGTDVFVYDRQTNAVERLELSSGRFGINPAISADGRYVAFESQLGIFPSRSDIVIHDRISNTYDSLTGQASGIGFSRSASISADGRIVSFSSRIEGLVPSEPFRSTHVFVYNQDTASLSRITADADANSSRPYISGNGQFVAMQTRSSELVPGDTNNVEDIVIYNLGSGSFEPLYSTDISFEVAGGNDESSAPSVSGNGRFVAYESNASNLVSGDTNERSDIFVYDRQSGNNENLTAESNLDSSNPSISVDGRFVAFEMKPRNASPQANLAATQIYLHDRNTNSTEALTPVGGAGSFNPSVSGDGRFVVFESQDSNLSPEDSNGETSDIFLYDRDTNITELLTAGGNGNSHTPVISRDGRFVAYSSEAGNLGPTGGLEGVFNIFVYDRVNDTTEILTPGGNNASLEPAISDGGQFVAFASNASNLVDVPNEIPNRTFRDRDIFLYDRNEGTTQALTPRIDSQIFTEVSISGDGRLVTFSGGSSTLVPEDSNSAIDVFVYDQDTQSVRLLATGSDGAIDSPSVSSDGQVIAFASLAMNLANDGTVNTRDVFVFSTNEISAEDPPTAIAQSLTVAADTSLSISLRGVDPAGSDLDLLYELVSDPTAGVLQGTPPDLTYTPNQGFIGDDSFEFQVSANGRISAPALVTIDVQPSASEEFTLTAVQRAGQRTIDISATWPASAVWTQVRAFEDDSSVLWDGQARSWSGTYTPSAGVTSVRFNSRYWLSGEITASNILDVTVTLEETGPVDPPSDGAGGYAWFDSNGDSLRDADESGDVGRSVTLFRCAPPWGIAATATTVAPDGRFDFPGLAPGEYQMQTAVPADGFSPVTGDNLVYGNGFSNCATFDGSALDFGIGLKAEDQQPPTDPPASSLSGFAWIDSNGDGVRDANEPAETNRSVTLYRCGPPWGIAGTATTDSDGLFTVDGLEPTEYQLGTPYPANGFSPRTADNDVYASGFTDCVQAGSGESLGIGVR